MLLKSLRLFLLLALVFINVTINISASEVSDPEGSVYSASNTTSMGSQLYRWVYDTAGVFSGAKFGAVSYDFVSQQLSELVLPNAAIYYHDLTNQYLRENQFPLRTHSILIIIKTGTTLAGAVIGLIYADDYYEHSLEQIYLLEQQSQEKINFIWSMAGGMTGYLFIPVLDRILDQNMQRVMNEVQNNHRQNNQRQNNDFIPVGVRIILPKEAGFVIGALLAWSFSTYARYPILIALAVLIYQLPPDQTPIHAIDELD
ncbi:hypothetical protein EOPP23_13580 [Endozoicomonas sp. OPT23]|uniref:hypothetical protein n=1 Tax=Endozoicomonas sp. OPT23 TaxID=2072845 RepID=UPI00129B9519|nr:hypothetical protein [Endozoicomonas sp. OPT23]MRI34022.1 hypothetical protein [Endozoicomonas sp. OPT23]